MTPEMQTKLLKVLEGGEFRRVGGVRTITVGRPRPGRHEPGPRRVWSGRDGCARTSSTAST